MGANPRLMVAMYSCQIQVRAEVLGKMYSVGTSSREDSAGGDGGGQRLLHCHCKCSCYRKLQLLRRAAEANKRSGDAPAGLLSLGGAGGRPHLGAQDRGGVAT